MIINKTVRAAVAVSLISGLYSSQALAAGFALIENSASGMGNAFAGGSAIADDASTVWFNPAGMTRLKGEQISIAGHIVSPAADFTNQGSLAVTTLDRSGTDDDGGVSAFVPNFYYVTQLQGDTWFGVGVTVPFGLSTEYDEDWVGRYTATKSEVHTLNINPSFAFKHSDELSIGLGLSLQYIEATLANELDTGMICAGVLSGGVAANVPAAIGTCTTNGLPVDTRAIDSSQELTGDDWNWGWNIGMLYELDKESRIGVAYRSSIDANLSGDVDFERSAELDGFLSSLTGPAAPLVNSFTDTGIQAGLELPAQLSVSYFRDVNADLSLMADVTWTEWSNFDALVIKFDNLVQSTSIVPENWEDSYRFAVGANYKTSDKVMLRAGVALDQSPIPSAEDRTPRIPGNDRTWVSIGMAYDIDENTSIDIGYSHLFVDDTEINNTDESFKHVLTGEYEADVDILSVQGNFKF